MLLGFLREFNLNSPVKRYFDSVYTPQRKNWNNVDKDSTLFIFNQGSLTHSGYDGILVTNLTNFLFIRLMSLNHVKLGVQLSLL